jgi:hypothetical protein
VHRAQRCAEGDVRGCADMTPKGGADSCLPTHTIAAKRIIQKDGKTHDATRVQTFSTCCKTTKHIHGDRSFPPSPLCPLPPLVSLWHAGQRAHTKRHGEDTSVHYIQARSWCASMRQKEGRPLSTHHLRGRQRGPRWSTRTAPTGQRSSRGNEATSWLVSRV